MRNQQQQQRWPLSATACGHGVSGLRPSGQLLQGRSVMPAPCRCSTTPPSSPHHLWLPTPRTPRHHSPTPAPSLRMRTPPNSPGCLSQRARSPLEIPYDRAGTTTCLRSGGATACSHPTQHRRQRHHRQCHLARPYRLAHRRGKLYRYCNQYTIIKIKSGRVRAYISYGKPAILYNRCIRVYGQCGYSTHVYIHHTTT